MKNQLLNILIALFLTFSTFTGCTTKTPDDLKESQITDDAELFAIPTMEELLINRDKIEFCTNIKQRNGKVYASGYLCLPEWNPIPGATQYSRGMVVVGDYAYYIRPKSSDEHPTELFRSDLNGENEIIITDNAFSYGSLYAIDNKIIYETYNYEQIDGVGHMHPGVMMYYDTATSQIKNLSDNRFVLFSYDDEFVYFTKFVEYMYNYKNIGDIWRVKWDGTGEKLLEGLIAPDMNNNFLLTDDGFPSNTIVYEGWAYSGDQSGIYKKNISDGEIIKLADLSPGIYKGRLFFYDAVDDYIYFRGLFYANEHEYDYYPGFGNAKLFRLHLDGGDMEYLNISWTEV